MHCKKIIKQKYIQTTVDADIERWYRLQMMLKQLLL